MNAWQVWIWLSLDSIHILLSWLGFGGIFVTPFLCAIACEDNSKRLFRIAKILGVVTGVSILLAVLLPTTKQAAVIYAIPKLANSSIITNDVPEVYGMAVEKLKDVLRVEGVEKP